MKSASVHVYPLVYSNGCAQLHTYMCVSHLISEKKHFKWCMIHNVEIYCSFHILHLYSTILFLPILRWCLMYMYTGALALHTLHMYYILCVHVYAFCTLYLASQLDCFTCALWSIALSVSLQFLLVTVKKIFPQ